MKNARNAEYTKAYNQKLFLRLLRQEPLTRAEIARRMGLTRAATSLIAEELLAQGCICEAPAPKPSGGNPVPLRLKQERFYGIGIYLNRVGCHAGIVDFAGNLICQQDIPDAAPDRIPLLTDTIVQMLQQHRIPSEKVVGVGISAPGPLDGEQGRILNPPGFEHWHNTDLGAAIQARLQLPVQLSNNAAALAQFHLGKEAAMGSENFLLLLVDSGLGSGVISRGKLLKGAGYFTGELGHTTIQMNGRPCACGNFGCLEAYASMPGLLRGSGFESWQQIMNTTDSAAQRLVRQELDYLTTGIVNMANLVSIDTVLLAGDILYHAEIITPPLEAQINRRILRRGSLPIRVSCACSGPDVPIQSAAELAFDRFLRV